jgi:hypothetical protein
MSRQFLFEGPECVLVPERYLLRRENNIKMTLKEVLWNSVD